MVRMRRSNGRPTKSNTNAAGGPSQATKVVRPGSLRVPIRMTPAIPAAGTCCRGSLGSPHRTSGNSTGNASPSPTRWTVRGASSTGGRWSRLLPRARSRARDLDPADLSPPPGQARPRSKPSRAPGTSPRDSSVTDFHADPIWLEPGAVARTRPDAPPTCSGRRAALTAALSDRTRRHPLRPPSSTGRSVWDVGAPAPAVPEVVSKAFGGTTATVCGTGPASWWLTRALLWAGAGQLCSARGVVSVCC